MAANIRSTAEGLAESLGLRFRFRAEPAVGAAGPAIAAAAFEMIDAAVAGELRAHRRFALDRTAGRHLWIGREQQVADFGAPSLCACGPEQIGGGLVGAPRGVRPHEAVLPESLAGAARLVFVRLEPALGLRFEVER